MSTPFLYRLDPSVFYDRNAPQNRPCLSKSLWFPCWDVVYIVYFFVARSSAAASILLLLLSIFKWLEFSIILFFNIIIFGKDELLCNSVKSSLSIFAQKYFCKCKDTYFIITNKYLHIYKDSFGAKILKDDCAHSVCVDASIDLTSQKMSFLQKKTQIGGGRVC